MHSTSSLSNIASGPYVSSQTAQLVLTYGHYVSPILLFVLFVIIFTTHSIATASKEDVITAEPSLTGPGGKPLPRNISAGTKASREESVLDFSRARKLAFAWISVGLILTLVANAAAVFAHALIDRKQHWWCGQSVVVYVLGTLSVYTVALISIVDTKPSPTVVHFSTWVVGLLAELILFGASLALYTSKHREFKVGSPKGGQFRKGITKWESVEVGIDLARILFLAALVFLYSLFQILLWAETGFLEASSKPRETERLLDSHDPHNRGTAGKYGTADAQNGANDTKEGVAGWVRPETLPSKTWWEYIRSYSLFFPYIWPANSLRLQLTVTLCFGLVIAQRAVNLLVPVQAGRIINDLSGENGADIGIPWLQISLYIVFRLLQGSSGLIQAARSVLWIPINQYSYQELSTSSFEHVHSLSLDFHLGKKTGEVISAMGKGTSISNFLESVTFSILPMIIDLGVAIGYFLIEWDAYFALVISIMSFAYIYLTIRMAQWRNDIRRQMTNLGRTEDAVKNDSLVSYETVKYFNAEPYEFDRYRNAVGDMQEAQYKVELTLNYLNLAQNFVFMLGLLITCFIAAYQVTAGQRKVGDFVALLTYMAQLQAPLNYFGTFYRTIQAAMINAERLLELFKERPTVKDQPNAEDLPTCKGDIRFNDVKFAYDPRKPALKGLDFHCAPGTTTALVGESGGGKSTVFRLLFRFYNLTSGSIQVDGHDVRDVTIEGLRRHIGVVPQDTVLFNETLMYNLRYAKPNATDEEIFNACRAASIHEKILNFADGYESRVGERGLKLSGGEKQRVAIARTILKDPGIILLDEATAALDTETEEHIQEALDKLSQGRTTLVIAHRLSTITTADQILVLHSGKVVESGTHEELLSIKGRYASMWHKQTRTQKAAEEAKVLSDRADQLRHQSQGDDSASQSEEERSGPREHMADSLTMTAAIDTTNNSEDGGFPEGHP